MASSFKGPAFSAVSVAVALGFAPLGAFSHAAVGDKIESRELPAFGGGEKPFLGDARANVFFFVRPDQEHSRQVLAELASLTEDLAGRSVYWTAIVSDRFSEDEIRTAVEGAGLDIPVLIDEGDALYGELGAALHPVLGIADQDHVLVAYQAFRKIHFRELLRARVRHQLGEITDEELARVEDPPRTDLAGRDDGAERHLRFARMLLQAGKADQALESIARSLEIDPEQAPAHALAGSILAGRGDCAGALEAFERALALDPGEPSAMEGKAACEGSAARGTSPGRESPAPRPAGRRSTFNGVPELVEGLPPGFLAEKVGTRLSQKGYLAAERGS
jgi:tetratricopeptide (TPR) repeat protein